MPRSRIRHGIIALGVAALAACTTTSADKHAKEAAKGPTQPPPAITANMPLAQALEAGIDYGGDTLAAVKRLIKHRGEGEQAAALLQSALHDGVEKYEHNQLLNAGHLYVSMPMPVAVGTFQELIGSERPVARQVGWQLAATKPAPALAKAIDAELSRALADNEEEAALMPQMANAVRANHLVSAYTLVREGLMAKGDEEFAQAMTSLDAQRAANDFLAYLALAPGEELRQLTLSSVNLYTCLAILHHMEKTPPTVGATNFEHLFYYAVSRNTMLADAAQGILEAYVPHSTEHLAQVLAKQPAWVQVAYLENVRRKLTPKIGLLLGELKRDTAESDVVEEINEIKF
jgi:hypothetical protein